MNDAYVFAHTTPVYVTVAGQPVSSPEDARFYADWIEGLIRRTNERGRFANSEHRTEVTNLFEKALAIYKRQSR